MKSHKFTEMTRMAMIRNFFFVYLIIYIHELFCEETAKFS
jgi:hypothetical protein